MLRGFFHERSELKRCNMTFKSPISSVEWYFFTRVCGKNDFSRLFFATSIEKRIFSKKLHCYDTITPTVLRNHLETRSFPIKGVPWIRKNNIKVQRIHCIRSIFSHFLLNFACSYFKNIFFCLIQFLIQHIQHNWAEMKAK